MKIQTLDVSISENEINELVAHYIIGSQLKSLKSTIKPDSILVKGLFNKGIAVSFESSIKVDFTANEIILQIQSFKVLGGFGSIFKKQLLQFVLSKIDMAGLYSSDDCIIININSFLKGKGIKSNFQIHNVTVKEKSLSIKIDGGLDL